MKLSEYKNEDAIDLLADIFEPATMILGDPEIAQAVSNGTPKLKIVTLALKNHKKEVLQILAVTDGVPVEEYECNPMTILAKILDLLNDKELLSFFSSQSQTDSKTSSGSHTENTKAKGK